MAFGARTIFPENQGRFNLNFRQRILALLNELNRTDPRFPHKEAPMKDRSVAVLSDITVHMKYARHIPDANRRET